MNARMVPRRSPSSIRAIRWTRHTSQALVAAFIVVVVAQKALGAAGAASGEAFCPFGGFETAFTWATTGRTVSHIHPANLVLAGLIVVLALAARGAFCGWLCPLGALQEAVNATATAITDHVPPLRRLRHRWSGDHRVLSRVDRVARYGRYVVLVWAVGGAALTGVMVFRDYDPWNALLSVVEFELTTGFVVLIAMLLLSIVVPRPFCRYACPLGATIGLIGKASPVAVQRDADSCIGCDLCSKACPMGLQVHTATKVTDAQCIGCLECVAACPSRDALAVKVSLPFPAVRSQAVDDAANASAANASAGTSTCDTPSAPRPADDPTATAGSTLEGALR